MAMRAICGALNAMPGVCFFRSSDRIDAWGDGWSGVLFVTVGTPTTDDRREDIRAVRKRGIGAAVVHDVPGAVDTVTKWRREIAAERGAP